MSKEGVLSVNTSGAAVIETLSSEGGPDTPPNGHNFNFSGSIAGGSAANGAIEFITPGGPGADEDGQMDAKVLVDGTTIDINASNQLHVIGGVFSEMFTVDAFTPPGTNPVVPTAGGNINITGGQVAAGTTANVIRTDSLADNTYTIQVQRSQAVASSTIGDNGVSHFNSAQFNVDSNGFVSISGTGSVETLTGNTGGAIAPVAGNINTVGTGSITIAGSGNTLTSELTGLNNHSVLVGAGTATITNVGPTATAGQVLQSAGSSSDPAFSTATYPLTTTIDQILYSSAANTVTGLATANQAVLTTGTTGIPVLTPIATNGQLIIGSTAGAPAAATLTAGTGITITNASNSITIAASGSVVTETLTGDTGGALSPTAGNFNIVANPTAGSSVKIEGSGSTLTLNVTDTNNNTFLGASCGNTGLSGNSNGGFGSSILQALTSGTNNFMGGRNSGIRLTSGNNNAGWGNGSFQNLLTGTGNAGLGNGSGSSYTGAESNNICLVNTGTIGDSGIIRIGVPLTHTSAFIAGITGVSVSNLNIVTINTSTGQLGSQAAANVGTVTQYDVLVGGAAGAIASVGPGSSGQILQSGGSSANPAYSTATYPATATGTGTLLRADGTNWSATTSTYPNTNAINTLLYASSANVMSALSTANNGVLITSATGVPSLLADGTTGQVLTATTGSPPSWANPATSGTVTSVSGTANQVAVATGTTTPVISLIGPYTPSTYTAHSVIVGEGTSSMVGIGPGSSGQVFQSGGASADPAYSTATYPATATGTGTILRADGTNWSATTATYPNSTTSQQILYSTANNVIGELTTANSKLPATNASGTLAMRAFSVNTQVFTSSGTYTPTSGMLYCKARIVGGGGAGGGAPSTTSGQFSAGTGGGAGEYAEGTFSAATIGSSQTVTIAAAATGVSGAAGNNGGTCSLGALITAFGGTGGPTLAATTAGSGNGGAGGTGGSGGSFRTPGFIGGLAYFGVAGGSGFGGQGANSQFGSGGAFQVNVTGLAGNGYGAGGGGVLNGGSQSAHTGGAGTAGIIVIDEYVIA
jgi:hypothetical protein